MTQKCSSVPITRYLVAFPLLPQKPFDTFRENARRTLLRAGITCCIPTMEAHINMKVPFVFRGRKGISTASELKRFLAGVCSGPEFRAIDVALGEVNYFESEQVLYQSVEDVARGMVVALVNALKDEDIEPASSDTGLLHSSIVKKVHEEKSEQARALVGNMADLPTSAYLSKVRLYDKLGKRAARVIAEYSLAEAA